MNALRSMNVDLHRGPVVVPAGREDLILAVATFFLVALGFVMVLNTSYFYGRDHFSDPYRFTRTHLVAMGIGGFALLGAWRVPTWVVRRLTYPALGAAIAGLVLTLVPGFGEEHGGARRWLRFGPVAFQPSEAAKLAIILYLAHSLAKKGEAVERFVTGFVPHLLVVGLVATLVILEPDYGTTVLLGGLLFLMLFAAGARLTHLASVASLAVPGLAALAFTEEYRLRRLVSFWNPWEDAQASGFQLVQSLLAFGSGGISGVGLGAGRQKMFYLPGAHTDFVFSVIGEELGLIGALAVVGAFGLLAFAGFRLAWRHPDPYAGHLALGLTSLLVLQAAINMGVAVGLLPTKGIALPFLSYGGSALVSSMLAVGLLLRLAHEARWGTASRPWVLLTPIGPLPAAGGIHEWRNG